MSHSAYKGKNKKPKNRIFMDKQRENGSKTIDEIKFNHKKGNYDVALVLIDDYLRDHPNDTYVQTYKAMTLFRAGKKEESVENFKKILEQNNMSNRNKMFAMTQYAYVLSQMHNNEDAIYYYEKVINESKELNLIARSKLSVLYSEEENYDEAINVLNIDGYNDSFLNVKRAKVYSKQGRYFKALKELEKEEYNNYNVYVKENLDNKYIEQEKLYLKGHVLYKLDREDEALIYLSNACTIKTRDTYFLAAIDMVRIYFLKLQLDDAINLCEELKKNCDSKHYLRIIDELLAKAYLKKNDYVKAEDQFKNIETSEARKNMNLGKIELLKGNFEKAEEYFSDFDINSNIKENYENLCKLTLIKFRLGKYDEVLEILAKFDENMDKFEIRHMAYEFRRIRLCINKIRNEEFGDIESYSEKQIVSYDIEAAIDHVVDHHYVNAKTSKFNDEINIERLFTEIKDKLSSEKVIYDSVFDKYVLKYPNIGVNMDGENIHQLLVLTLPNSKDIINMYPYDGTESVFNLEELEEKPKPKVKRLTQTDKFNRKMAKFNKINGNN